MLTVDKYSHYFRVHVQNRTQEVLIRQFALRFVQYGYTTVNRQVTYTALRVFAASNKDRTEYRFHINAYQDFLEYLRNNAPASEKDIQLNDYTVPDSTEYDFPFKVKPQWQPRDYQVPVIEYLCNPNIKPNRLVTLSTGAGKSYSAMQSAANLGKRLLMCIRPAFMDKWVDDFLATYDNIEPTDIASIRGEAQLMRLMRLDESEIPPIIIMSNSTFRMYIKKYEEFGEELKDMGYEYTPDEFFQAMRIGIRCVDEAHLDFHFNFKLDMYSNVPHAFALSASLIDPDPFIQNMQKLQYPIDTRYKAPPPKKYIDAYGVMYRLAPNRKPRTNWPGRKEYSHGAFEKWALKETNFLDNYLYMLKDTIDNSYIKNYKPGDRLLVFCYSIEMATTMTRYLAEVYPDKSVERYVEDDEYKNVMEPDIRVSTVLSAGTGIDIANLKVAILTTAISSPKSNIQAIGRLRETKDGTTPEFYWFSCLDIPKHTDYHRAKKEVFADRTRSIKDLVYNRKL